jgi:hypothetical protein
MRARRPELFSDSKTVREPHLTREIFEYHLETLTNRKEETVFEYFARRLAEKELCPNLLPQTGPTGGGDSKVDAETYPVADALSLRWYEAIAREASKERWAFAFSAKKAWRSKVQSDIKKIAGTNRGYTQAYFITNQFVPDKDRAKVEGDLEKKYGLPVRILDRTWIVTSVFERDRLSLAIETLSLQGYEERPRTLIGPQDLEHERSLEELDDQITDSARYEGVDYQLAEDCLQAALLARALERPRHEIEGRLDRAARIAEQLGHQQLRLRVAYNKAWTVFWWYEDFETFNRLYDEVENFAIGSQQVTDIELLANIWTLLINSLRQGRIDAAGSKLEARTRTVKSELGRLASDHSRRNNALSARTNKLFVELTEAFGDQPRLDSVFGELSEVLRETEGLTAYPLEAFARILRELGDAFADNARFDELIETIVAVTEERTSQGEAGRVLLERGYQKLENGKIYDAIRLFGRAQQKLAMREYREQLVAALVGCGLAYESAGLLWAARANVLGGANQALSEYWEHGDIVPHAVSCLQRLVWIELQLGRVPNVLQWMEASFLIAEQVLRTEKTKQRFTDQRTIQDRVLAILLLKVDFWQLKWLDFLPAVLEKFGLDYSWMALLYALGHEQYLRSEEVIPSTETEQNARTLFSEWFQQPAADDLPDTVELQQETHVLLRSFVLGCEITIRVANNLQSIQLAETILATLESLLATSLDAELCPFVSELAIEISASDLVSDLPTYEFDEGDLSPRIKLRHSPNIHTQITNDYSWFRRWLEKFIIHTVVRITFISDVDAWARRLFRDEAGMGRALNFTESSIPIENILGKQPKYRLSDWEPSTSTGRFPLTRNEPWNAEQQNVQRDAAKAVAEYQIGSGEPPTELLKIDKLKHRSRRVYSLINLPLWDKAKWDAIAYVVFPDVDWPPYFALGFKNPEAGKSIFKGWLEKLGRVDRDEALKVTIISGIDKDYPASYRVVIGTNPQVAHDDPSSSHFVVVSRIHRMDPPDSRNLDNFRRRLEQFGRYMLIPAHYVNPVTEPNPFFELGVLKSDVRFRSAWEIGENDTDVVAIGEDDNPIIPEGMENAPVLSAIARFKKRRLAKGKLPREVSGFIEANAKEIESDHEAIKRLFEYLSKDQIKGHWSCYCGSGKKLRDCHFDELSKLRSDIDVKKAKKYLKEFEHSPGNS